MGAVTRAQAPNGEVSYTAKSTNSGHTQSERFDSPDYILTHLAKNDAVPGRGPPNSTAEPARPPS